ncbi:MAG: alpha/beta hydrolase [Bacteroidales bacterium]|nr:alpha/beta hydrolase [Bacteroidales bacterium]
MGERVTIKEAGEIYISVKYPDQSPSAVVILVHGLGEHQGRYNDWCDRFLAVNIGVARFDLPGHGRSGGRRGHIAEYSQVKEIIMYLSDIIRSDYPAVPLILYGHSLGGNIVLDTLLSGINGFSSAVVTSPWIKLAFEPGKLKILLARFVGLLVPSMAQPTGLMPEHLSSDPEVAASYRTDPLVHPVISVALYSSAARAAARVLRDGSMIKIPLLLVHGTDDKISSPHGAGDLASIVPHATLKLWERGYHELHNEPFKGQIFSFIHSWIKENLPETKD